jgi:hypothetical protein
MIWVLAPFLGMQDMTHFQCLDPRILLLWAFPENAACKIPSIFGVSQRTVYPSITAIIFNFLM